MTDNAEQNLAERSLSASGFADKAKGLAFLYFQRNAVERLDDACAFLKISSLNREIFYYISAFNYRHDNALTDSNKLTVYGSFGLLNISFFIPISTIFPFRRIRIQLIC